MVPNFPKNCVGDFFFPKFRISKKITSQKLHRKGAPLATPAAWGCCLAIPRPTFSGSGPVFFLFSLERFSFFGRLFLYFWRGRFLDFALGLRGPPTKITIFSSWTFFRKFPCLLVFGPLFFIFGTTVFSFLVGRFFDLGSAGIRIWAPGMFPYGEVSVKRFFSKCEILEKKIQKIFLGDLCSSKVHWFSALFKNSGNFCILSGRRNKSIFLLQRRFLPKKLVTMPGGSAPRPPPGASPPGPPFGVPAAYVIFIMIRLVAKLFEHRAKSRALIGKCARKNATPSERKNVRGA